MRTMRIIPWKDESGFRGTLVMEWYNEKGGIEKDLRYQLLPDEFFKLVVSCTEALEWIRDNGLR